MITVHYAWRLGPKTTYGIQGYNTTATGYEGEYIRRVGTGLLWNPVWFC